MDQPSHAPINSNSTTNWESHNVVVHGKTKEDAHNKLCKRTQLQISNLYASPP